jgi:hypothetical protein
VTGAPLGIYLDKKYVRIICKLIEFEIFLSLCEVETSQKREREERSLPLLGGRGVHIQLEK